MTTHETLYKCFENICKEFGVPANLSLSSPLRDRGQPNMFVSFVDIHASSNVSFYEQELLQQFLKNSIKSKKDYRKFRAFVRIKLISALRSLHDLTGEGLRNLGALPQ